jgi:A/G-specific adenine glycosylase
MYKKFTQDLLFWYKQSGRTLPWRQTTDPYKIMVSEFMLQQTQVSRVIPKYHAFLEKFPTMYDLAKAPLSDVLILWQGLGYNRRAKFLQQAAQAIVKNHNGVVPSDPAVLEELPGFGPYAANAVAAFAYNKPVIVIDANVRRVFNYVFGLKAEQIAAAVAQALPKEQPRDFYNALMDIGSAYYKTTSDDKYPFKEYCFHYNKKPIPSIKKIKQSKFHGSNRWYRGQILQMLSQGRIVSEQSLEKLEFSDKYLAAKEQLLHEGMIQEANGTYKLP